jgi:hypothetical protein
MLGAICFVVLCGLLTAGLWPFNPFPRNEVSWSTNSDGLRFGDYGVVLSAGVFERASGRPEASCSIEIWLQPGLTDDSNTMVAFSKPDTLTQFRVAQRDDDMFVTRDFIDEHHHLRTVYIEIDHAFRQGKMVLISITSGKQGTGVYLNDVLVKVSARFGLTSKDCAGQLIVGNSTENDSWSGLLQGVAIYNRELTAAQISRDYDYWLEGGRSELVDNKHLVALYLFEEREGRVVHNQTISGPDLYIPEHYMVLHKTFLTPFWKEFRPNWSYYKDVIINIVGFIPLGFVLVAYFSSVRSCKWPALITLILGGMVALIIEVLQGYLPTRDSSSTDVIMNTLGNAIGVALYAYRVAEPFLARVGVRLELRGKASTVGIST